MSSLEESKPWLQATLILILLSAGILLAEKLYGSPLFREEFKIFIFYGPAALTLAVYLILKFTGKAQGRRT